MKNWFKRKKKQAPSSTPIRNRYDGVGPINDGYYGFDPMPAILAAQHHHREDTPHDSSAGHSSHDHSSHDSGSYDSGGYDSGGSSDCGSCGD